MRFTMAMIGLLLLATTGCEDRSTTYYSGPEGSPKVQANEDMFARSESEPAKLTQEWIEYYLTSLVIQQNEKPLYNRDRLHQIIPEIQRALADRGNVRIDRAFEDNMTMWSEHRIKDGKIVGEFAGSYVSGQIPATPIPATAYAK